MTTTVETNTVAPKSPAKRTAAKNTQPTAKIQKTVTPKLVCQVTGLGRYTNAAYLQKKAQQRNCSVEDITKHYVSREVAKQLRSGKTVTEIQGILGSTFNSPIADLSAETILRFNGKTKNAK